MRGTRKLELLFTSHISLRRPPTEAAKHGVLFPASEVGLAGDEMRESFPVRNGLSPMQRQCAI
jgi:hypothetical protein